MTLRTTKRQAPPCGLSEPETQIEATVDDWRVP